MTDTSPIEMPGPQRALAEAARGFMPVDEGLALCASACHARRATASATIHFSSHISHLFVLLSRTDGSDRACGAWIHGQTVSAQEA